MSTLFELLSNGAHFDLKIELLRDDSVRGVIEPVRFLKGQQPFQFIVTRSNPNVMERQGSPIDLLNKTIHSEDSKQIFKKINKHCDHFEENKEEILKDIICKAHNYLRLNGYKAMLEYIENESSIEILPKIKTDEL